MNKKLQTTGLHKNFGRLLTRLRLWSSNPWRRYSIFLIFFLLGFVLGSSLGMINGALALMDPVGAFVTLLFLELLIRLRKQLVTSPDDYTLLYILDLTRIGIIYGLFIEAFKLM